MKSASHPPSSAPSVRRYRERLRENGLVKKEVWILPEHKEALEEVAAKMRVPGQACANSVLEVRCDAWSLDALTQALAETAGVRAGRMTIEKMEGGEPSLRLTMHDHGGLPVLLAIGGEQILVETYLWPQSSVRDTQAFNVTALQTQKYLPLSAISLTQVGNEPVYTLFGALDCRSGLPSVLLEIQAIADNAIAAVELYAEHLLEETA